MVRGRDRMQAPMRGIAAPRERKRDRAFALLEVGARERATDPRGDGFGSDLPVQSEFAGQHGQVLQRQFAGIGDEDGVAADLDRELRRADHCRADALARVPDRSKILPVRQHVAQLFGEFQTKIAEPARLALVDILADAAGKGDGVDAPVGKLGRPGFGDEQGAGKFAGLAQIYEAHDHAGHACGDAPAIRRHERHAECEFEVERLGDYLSRLLDAREAPSAIRDNEPSAHGNRAGGKDAPSFGQRELGRAAADIHVEQRRVVPARKRNRARPVRRHLAFHVMSGRGADELAGFLGKEVSNGASVAPL